MLSCGEQLEFADKRLLLADIDYELFKQLHQAFIMSKDIVELVNACDKILYRRMENRIVSDALLLAATMISDSHGQVKVKEVAQQTCYSERHCHSRQDISTKPILIKILRLLVVSVLRST